MTTDELLSRIYERREVVDPTGAIHRLHSEVSRDEGEMIARVIRQYGFTRTLEIGCGFGLSSLYICGALCHHPGTRHTIIDPGQTDEWHRIGVSNLERCGVTGFELIERPSEIVLPEMLARGQKFDFALIDGWHTFDHVLLDFFYVNRLIDVGGVIVLDDLQLPAIRKVARYISTCSHYRIVDTAAQSIHAPSWRKKITDALLRKLSTVLPDDYSKVTFEPALFSTDFDLGLTSEMVAFRKTADDQRDSHWFRPF